MSDSSPERHTPTPAAAAELTEVFVITSGVYSDYGIESIWLTAEEAEAALAERTGANSYDGPRIEVWPVGRNQRTHGEFTCSCWILQTGEAIEVDEEESSDLLNEPRVEVTWRETGLGWVAGRPRAFQVRVSAETAERAKKVYSETVARVRAQISEGLPPELIANVAEQR